MSGRLYISWKDKVEFIESLLIPAFNTKNALDTPVKRDEWLANRAEQKKWNSEVAGELIERYGAVKSLEEAEKKLEGVKAERLLEKAEENESKQGKKFHLFFVHRSSTCFCLFLSIFILYFHMLLIMC